MCVTIWECMARCYWKSHAASADLRFKRSEKHGTVRRCIQYQSLSVCVCVAAWYQSGCAGARSERHVAGRRSCTSGIWKASPRSAVWCGEAGFPSGWRRPHTECSGMASRLKTHSVWNNPARSHTTPASLITRLILISTTCCEAPISKTKNPTVVFLCSCWVEILQ